MKYIATGRVHPERADIRFGLITWEYSNQGRVVAHCDSSQITVLVELTSVDGFITAYIVAEQFAHIAVGALGFSLGSGYSVELIQITEEDGTPHVFGVHPTGTTSAEHLGFTSYGLISNRAFQLATQDVVFRLALRDYLPAITDSIDCGTYCYRAIESLKSSFAAKTGMDSWTPMHAALGTDRTEIDKTIKVFANPVRHGNWVNAKPSTASDRWQMLKLTREALSKYLELHQ